MWDIHGVIPPVIGDDTSTQRSPYEVDILTFVQMFSLSKARIAILKNFLYYRNFLYDNGVTTGFQWVNGSFTENVETLRQRPPNDIDVVSFITQSDAISDELSDHDNIKQTYRVDGYFVDLNDDPEELVTWTAYWYSMWSHQRETKLWKGFFKIPFSTQADQEALSYLEGK